jgi:unsaturated rhamnogalacturonyl hydrolase
MYKKKWFNYTYVKMRVKSQFTLYVIVCIVLLGFTLAFTYTNKEKMEREKPGTLVDINLPMSRRMAESIMLRTPHLCHIDFDHPRWTYVPGLVGKAMIELWKVSGENKYYDYAKAYVDTNIDEQGKINGFYKLDHFNIDHINSGKLLFYFYQETKEEKYKNAILTLRKQIEWMPRTTEGGFWHKRIYPWQMWLDGIYMGSPFYAQYICEFGDKANYEDVANQIILIDEKTYDPQVGLHYHGWDESRIQRWADPETGLSPNFWSRAMGWYSMALVDVLDFFPEKHPDREKIIEILGRVVDGLVKYQDKKTGLWYQVLDQAGREGNYLEASGTSMFVYSIAKAVKKGYIDKSYYTFAKKGHQGLLEHLIRVEDNGLVTLTHCCTSAGLGGNPYRDGSYEYYVNEEVVDNDGKSLGPFVLACLMIEEMEK